MPNRKIFISMLGTGLYEKCRYQKDSFVSSSTCFIQQAALEYINAKSWNKDDIALFLLTDKARQYNWNKDIMLRKKPNGQEVAYQGLEKILQDMNLPCLIENIPIPEGKNEGEFWEIFNKAYSAIGNGDEIYLDVTHGFRVLPMLMLIFCNYAAFLKNAKVKHISYGAFEAKDENNSAPLIDLLPFVSLQNWTSAASNFLIDGNVKELADLTKEEVSPIAKDATHPKSNLARLLNGYVSCIERIVEDFQTCRNISVVSGKNIKELRQKHPELTEIIIAPLKPIIEKINASLSELSDFENIKNGYIAAKWCVEHNLYQQALTILEENMISDLLGEFGFLQTNKEKRNFVSNALSFEAETKICESEKEEFKIISQNEKLKNYRGLFNKIRELRNDYNHAGMRDEQMKAGHIKSKIKKYLDEALQLIDR
ncbi:MAG: TIGR02221 family CRISPR-associated protein [Endomicrobium sp.]|nr:TIGR02221 family CRISPR-associated protein [Endomicrobium sp.]